MNKSLSITVRETPSTPMSDPDGVLARSGGRRAPTSTEVRSRSGALRAGARVLRLSAPVCARPQSLGGSAACRRRDRFTSAPRSVEFRAEIGSGRRPDARRVLLGLGK